MEKQVHDDLMCYVARLTHFSRYVDIELLHSRLMWFVDDTHGNNNYVQNTSGSPSWLLGLLRLIRFIIACDTPLDPCYQSARRWIMHECEQAITFRLWIYTIEYSLLVVELLYHMWTPFLSRTV
jgi:hypothetical protein